MKEQYITDRMTELSIMMSLDNNSTILKNKCMDIVKDLKTKDKNLLSKRDRVTLMSQFETFGRSKDPSILIKKVLEQWKIELDKDSI